MFHVRSIHIELKGLLNPILCVVVNKATRVDMLLEVYCFGALLSIHSHLRDKFVRLPEYD